MGNVERKLIEDFGDWRTKNKRSETSKEELKKDVGDFMEEKFQIKPNQTGGKQQINILDILDTMISPDIDVDVLFDANSVRENEIACQQVTKSAEDNAGCRYGILLVCAFALILPYLPFCLCPYFKRVKGQKGQKGQKGKGDGQTILKKLGPMPPSGRRT